MSRAVENWLFVGSMLLVLIVAGHPAAFMRNETVDMVFDLIGLAISVAGLLLRVVSRDWKIAYGKDCLVTGGPYSVVRHPMYVGSFLAGLGLCIILGSIAFTAVYVVCFIFVHSRIARREDKYMDGRWPEEHKSYAASVPACIPSIFGVVRLFSCYRRWLSSVPAAFARERSAICGILAGACASESISDVMASGWSDVRGEVFAWIIVVSAIMVMWLIVNVLRRAPAKV